MKLHEYTDNDGYLRCVLVRDGDPPGLGIPCDPPDPPGEGDLHREIHNALVSRRLFNWADVMLQNGVLTGVAKRIGRRHRLSNTEISAIRRSLIYAYKQRR